MDSEPPVRTAGILFSDVKGYSKLNQAQLKTFLTKILPALAKDAVDPFRKHFVELNTWGDGLLVASLDPYKLIGFAFELRDFYRNRHWAMDGLPKLQTRIALHAAAVFVDYDPIRQKPDTIIGTQVTKAARIEPITDPGEIWATQAFRHLIAEEQELPFAFDDLGEKELAKSYGSARIYRMRREYEPSTVTSHKVSQPVEASGHANVGVITPQTTTEDAASVDHPQAHKKDRGEMHTCKFHIMSPHYLEKNRWKTLADVLVEIQEKLPDGDWAREAYLIPSARALPKLRDAKLLKLDGSFLQMKSDATRKFIDEWEHHELSGMWFTMPTGKGQSTGVYSLDYDLFLNASLTT